MLLVRITLCANSPQVAYHKSCRRMEAVIRDVQAEEERYNVTASLSNHLLAWLSVLPVNMFVICIRCPQ